MAELGPDHVYRLSDGERDEALDGLRGAFEEGRLDVDEHESRSATAMRAVTNADLVPLYDDLSAAPAPDGTRLVWQPHGGRHGCGLP